MTNLHILHFVVPTVFIKGEYYYKCPSTGPCIPSNFKSVSTLSRQKVKTKYLISIKDVDDKRTVFDIGCVPSKTQAPSGKDILVRV